MKIKTITYNKVFSLGNYENEKLGIEIELQEGEDAQAAMNKAKDFVQFNHEVNKIHNALSECESILFDADSHTGTQLRQARMRKDDLLTKLEKGTRLLQ